MEKNGRFALVSVNSSRAFSSRVIKKTFLPYIKPVTQRDIGLLTMKVSFNLLVLISVEVVIYNVLILFILHKTVPFLLQKV